MTTSNATFIVEGRYYGTSPAPRNLRGELEEGRVFVCPICGNIWAIVAIPDQRFWAEHISCRKHRFHDHELPGSLWLSWDAAFNESFPQAVMEREFALAAAQYETA